MQKVAALMLALLVALSSAAVAQQDGFEPARPGYIYEFPRDHGAHQQFHTEWWYYTGHLRTARGEQFGFEVTFFRVGVVPPQRAAGGEWELRDLALAHFALTDIGRGRFRYYEKLNRAGRFTADAATGRLSVFNEGWRTEMLPDGSIRLRADGGGDAIDLVLRSRKPPAVHGENGVSVKAPAAGYSSHYYSLSRLAAKGKVTVGGLTFDCSGTAWMDHEFGSSRLRENQAGWDWFSIQLDNDTELMLYVIRRRDGTPDVTSAGSLVLSDGRVIHLPRHQFRVTSTGRWKSPKSGAAYPMGWKVELPSFGISLQVKERMKAQELITTGSTGVTYWEGAVTVSGRFGSGAVSGIGYVEMTGYDKPFSGR